MSMYFDPQKTLDAKQAIEPLSTRLRLQEQIGPFYDRCWDGELKDSTVIHLDDFSAIPFLSDITGVEEYQHRARLRAREGDAYVATTPPTLGYEAYCGRMLGLDPVEMLTASSAKNPLELSRACCQGKVETRLVEIAKSSESFLIHPFMGIERVWELAALIAEEAETAVGVIAPPPPVTWMANDKSLFTEIVMHVLGPEWLVEGQLAEEVSNLTVALASLAKRHSRVALKRLRCASAMGNRVFESAAIRAMPESEVAAEVREFLERTEWDGQEAVFAVAWEESDHSPSTQLWIPPEGRGQVRLDGVYEQLLAGERRVFVGSRPSTLPTRVNDCIGTASVQIASALQSLGYVGRCSFDFIVNGDLDGDFQARFTECNGRWGGASSPMALMDRLFPQGRPPYRARDFVHPGLVGAAFNDVLTVVDKAVWDHRSGQGRYLFYNTGPLRAHGKLDVIALGESQAEADAALEEDLPRILGLS